MKYAHALVAAAFVALVLTAVLGAGTASAKICSTAGTSSACGGSHGNTYTGSYKFSGNGGVIITSAFVTVTCTESSGEGEVTGTGNPATGNITKLTLGGCTNNINGGPCTASTSASSTNKWATTITTGAAPNGTMTLPPATFSFACNILSAVRTCNYYAADPGGKGEIIVTGGAPASMKVTSVPMIREDGGDALCSNTATWSGTYKVTTPANLYLT